MRKIILYGVILFQILIIISLVRGIQLSSRSASRIASMQETKAKLEQEREKLQKEKEEVSSDFYLEKVARDELHLSKPGETVVIIPDSVIVGAQINEPKIEVEIRKPNWVRWLEILSGKN
ncbi:MAG: septum formation initiator family protein [Microgenomates group bacterium]